MREPEGVPVPRGWTAEAAWKGMGASLLLHLFLGAAMIFALSGPPKGRPQVIDLTLLPPADTARHPVPHPFLAAVKPSRVPGRNVLPEPPALPAPQPVANPPEATPPASPSAEEVKTGSPPAPDLRTPLPPLLPRQARVLARHSSGGRRGVRAQGLRRRTSPGSATPSSTRSPTRQRRAGWGGRGRSWWPSRSSRTARYETCGSCKARGTPPWIGERSTRCETPPPSPVPPSRRRSSPRSSIG